MKKRNNGEWTESRFQSFIKSALRSASVRWPPKYKTLQEAYVGTKTNAKTGRQAKHFKCNNCKEEFVQKDVEVNHKIPVIPVEGFDSWDKTIDRLFCEKELLEVLCKPCHKELTKLENIKRKEFNARRKQSK